MATIEELKEFAKEADAAGDYEAASRTMDLIAGAGQKSISEQNAKKYDPSVGTGEYLLNSLKKNVGNTASLAGMVTSALRPGQDRFIPGGWAGQAERMADSALGTDRDMKAPGGPTRLAGAVTEFASPVISGALIKGAAHKGLATAAEVASTLFGGVGSEIGGDIAEDAGINRGWGTAVGGIAGSMGGSSIPTIASKALASKSNIASDISSRHGKQVLGLVETDKAAGKKIADSFKIADDIEAATGIPFEPSLAGRTRSPYVSNLEKEVFGRSAQAAERSIDKHTMNLAATRAFADKAFPGEIDDIQVAAYKALQAPKKKLNDLADALAAEQKAMSNSLEGTLPQEVGENLDKARVWYKAGEKKKLDEQIIDIYALARSRNVNATLDDAQRLVGNMSKADENVFQRLPSVFGKLLAKEEGGAASFEEFHSLWRETNRQLAGAYRAKDSDAIYFLNRLKDSLSKTAKGFEGEQYGALGREFAKYNKDYTDYAKAYKEGVGGRMEAHTKYGQTLSRERIVDKFFTPTGMDDFVKVYKSDPVVLQLLEDGILNKFHKYSVVEGAVDPKKAATFVKNHEGALNKIPLFKEKLLSAKSASEAILEKNARVLDAKTKLDESILGKLANTDNPVEFIDKAFTDRKALDQLLNGSGEVRKAALSAMAHRLPQVALRHGMGVGEFLYANKAMVEPMLNAVGPNHYKNMRTIAESMDMLNVGRPPAHPSLTQFAADPIERFTGTSLASLVSQYRATMITRQSSPTHMATSMLGKFWVKLGSEKSRLFQEHLLSDPDAARELVKAATSNSEKALSNSFKKHAMAAGIRIATQTSADVQE